MEQPNGAYAPIPTPLGENDELDTVALERHLRFLADAGLDGALVQGTNGEFPSFGLDERLRLAEAAAESASGLALMLGVGSCALPEVEHLLRAARSFGYRAALLPPPFYFRSAPAEGLAAFFNTALEIAELPVMLYHIPQVTGIGISDEILDAVEGHPRFAGVKDSSGSEEELRRFTDRLKNGSYMVGHDRLLSRARLAGGSGSITASASVVPELVAATQVDSHRQADLDAVRSLLEAHGLGPAVKAILRNLGFGAYCTRPPLVGLDPVPAGRLIRDFEALAG